MNYRLTAICTLIAFSTIATTAIAHETDDPKDVLKHLQGVWEIEEGVNQGKSLSEADLKGTTMVVKDKMIVTYDKAKKETYRASFTLDTTKKPFQINMITQMKQFPDAKAFGILRFDGDDEFDLAYALPGAPRPSEFKSPSGSKVMLFEMEKED